MSGFDPTSARPVDFDPTSATPDVPHRAPGATGFGMIGELIGDLTHQGPANHDPNALEQGIMGVAAHPLVRSAKATFQQAATTGLFAEPTRAVMEGINYGRKPGENDAAFHQRYNNALTAARQQATDDANAARVQGHPIERVAQQTLNLGANVAANPEYFLLPGMGVGNTAATRIASAGLGNAAIGNVSDDAAQLMDMAEGVKKNFDVKQNLEATLTSGLFGAGLHGAVEVAPFIKDMFTKRGVDTTPSADPRQSPITPMTTDHVSMNQADAMQYKQLLQTGSVDDIKDFFKGRNGPAPSWTDVNTWVQHRDASLPNSQHVQPNFDYEAEYNRHAEQQYHQQNRAAVEEHVNNQMAGWKNAPQVEVIHGPEDIEHPEIKQQALREDANGDALGFLGSDGKVRIFSGRITDPDTANSVLFHEGLGHFGLAEKFGDRLDGVLKSLLSRNVNQLSRDTDAWMKRNPGAYNGDRVRAAEEVLAEASQNGRVPVSWKNAMTSAIRQFGRKMGLKLAYNDAEVQHILAMSHDAVINGKSSAAANGFRGARQDPNKYMFTGQKAVNFDPESATLYKAKDGHLRNEIDDYPSKINEVERRGDYNLEEVLDHPELYENYPQLRHLPVRFDKLPEGEHGYYDTSDPHIGIDVDTNNLHSAVLHEVQHTIQHIEGHLDENTPSTTKLNDEEYRTDPLEQEAFATEDRKYFSPEMRAENSPKFVTRSQLASETDYVAHDLEGIYKALDEGYTPTTRTFAEDRRAALEAGFSPSQIKDLKERNPGELSTRLYRMQAAANMADIKLKELEDRLDTPDWAVSDQMQYLKILADRNYLVTRIKGERSELARALNISKAAASYSKATMQQMADMLAEQDSGLANLTDPTTFLKFAKAVKAMRAKGSTAGAHTMLSSVDKPYWEQYLNTTHMNMMLSGLSTHVKAPMDMATGIARDVIERALAMPVSKLRELTMGALGRKAGLGVKPEEVAGNLYGVIRAVTDGEVYRRMGHAVMTGEGAYVDAAGKHTPVQFMNLYGSTSNPNIPGVSIPSHLISAQDTFFRSIAMNQNLYSLGIREAREQLGPKASWDDVMTLGGNLARHPTPDMLKESVDLSNRTLLLNHNPLNNILDKWRSYRPGLTPWERIGRFVVFNLAPFIRVESNNLINRVVQRSPLGFLDPYTLGQLKQGGAKADIALTKIIYGTVLMGLYWNTADKQKDKLTGAGPDNPDKFKELAAAGFKPRSVHEDGRYNMANSLAMSVNPFDIHNGTTTMIAELREAYEKGANKGQVGMGLKLGLGSIMYNLADMSPISDIAPFTEAAQAHGKEGANIVSKFAADQVESWSPNLMGQTARLEDPAVRDTQPNEQDSIGGRIVNELKSTVPGLREQLPIKYSVYGTPLPNAASLTGVHTWIPGLLGNGTSETHDPAERELDRLTKSGIRIVKDDGHILDLRTSALITPVERSFTMNVDDLQDYRDSGRTDLNVDENGKVTLSPAQFEEYQRIAGRAIVETVRSEMSTPEWQKMSDEDKVLEVKDIQTDMKAAAKEALFDK